MTKQAHEDLTELLQRFLEEPAARVAHQDIQAGERLLDAYAAPAPDQRLLVAIKAQMTAASRRRQRVIRLVHGSVAAAAAVIVLALIGLFDSGAGNRPTMSYASIIPAAIWESRDIASDDLDIVYFTAEIRHLEAQMQALDAGEDGLSGARPDEFENELIALETEFWKG